MSKQRFIQFLESVFEKIDRITEKLIETHTKNSTKLNEYYENSLEKLANYRLKVTQIIEGFQQANPKFYFQKISEVEEMDDDEIKEEEKNWDFTEPSFKNLEIDPYKFDDLNIFKIWSPAEIQSCVHEQKKKVVVTYCKKAHCHQCLKESIIKRIKTCPCNVDLSPKNVHEVMGFNYKLDQLFQF